MIAGVGTGLRKFVCPVRVCLFDSMTTCRIYPAMMACRCRCMCLPGCRTADAGFVPEDLDRVRDKGRCVHYLVIERKASWWTAKGMRRAP